MTRDSDFTYFQATEDEVNKLVVGEAARGGYAWRPQLPKPAYRQGSIGVLVENPRDEYLLGRPVALVIDEDDSRRLYGRFATLRSDFSPLSAWCHILPRRLFDSLDDSQREADLGGLEAAWIGLIVAEACILANRPVSRVSIASCTATQSFTLARSGALWPFVAIPDVIDRYDSAQRLIRSSPPKVDELREKLLPVWLTLFGIYGKDNGASNPYLVLSELLRELIQLRRMGRKDEIVYIERAVSSALPPGYRISNIEELKPEDRVNLFDLIIKAIDGGNGDQRSVSILCFLAGYIVTIAAGGTPSLGLAEKVSGKWPQILAWAFLIGSLGERVLWNSGFDGLGRLVTKELLKSFRLTDYPSCDIFLDEGEVLVDKKLSDPLIHLKIKQQRIISVGILPGVALTVPIDEQVATPQRPPVAYEKVVAGGQRALFGRDINDIVDLLWPRFRDKIRAEFSPESEVTGRGRSKKKEPSQERLPFKK